MATISVIVPVYKVEKFLARCVDSVLGQSFADFELILVDDGSPDRCGEICDEYARKDARIHVIHRENGGLSAARNSGIEYALENSKSRYITFLDSDDWLNPEFLTRLYAAAENNGCAVAACTYYVTTGEDEDAPENVPVQCLTADGYYCGDNVRATAIACAKLYRKSLFESLRYPLGKLHEDEFTTYRAIYGAQKVAYLPADLYAYYQNPQGIMLSKWNPRRLHILEAFEGQIRYAREQKLDSFYRKAVRDYIYSIHEQLRASEESFHKELRRKYRSALKLGRECGVFPVCWKLLWAYEEAYPVKLFWWPLFRLRGLWVRLAERRKEA